jgi:hypothetical protein
MIQVQRRHRFRFFQSKVTAGSKIVIPIADVRAMSAGTCNQRHQTKCVERSQFVKAGLCQNTVIWFFKAGEPLILNKLFILWRRTAAINEMCGTNPPIRAATPMGESQGPIPRPIS